MSTPAPPPPTPPADDKDWTWVLDRPCPECGLDVSGLTRADIADRARAAFDVLLAALDEPGATVRPQPEVWSALEYGAHVRDVCSVFGARLALMRGRDDPLFANWDQDATALQERYWEQQPDVVADELREESQRLLAAIESVRDDEADRPGRRSNGSTFTVDTLLRYLLHDVVHHAHDVRHAHG